MLYFYKCLFILTPQIYENSFNVLGYSNTVVIIG